MLSAVRGSFRLLERRDRIRWIVTVAASSVISLVEIASATAVLVLMQFLTDDPSTVRLPVLGVAGERWPSVSDDTLIRAAAGVIGVLFLVRGALYLAHVHAQSRVAYAAGVRLSARLARTYLAMPYRWHLERNSSQLVANIVEAVNQVVVYVLVPTSSAISSALLAATLIGVLLVTDPASTLAGGLLLGAVVALVLVAIRPRLGALARKEIEGYELSLATVQEAFAGLRDVKIYDLEDQVVSRLTRGRSAQARANYMRGTFTAFPRVIIETAAVLALLAFLLVRQQQASSEDALATLGLFGYAIIRLLPTMNTLLGSINTVQYGAPAVENIAAELGLAAEAGQDEPTGPKLDHQVEIELKDVSFGYSTGRGVALEEVNLRIRPGESVGIVGPTGSGKTTLLDLIAGLLDPTSGTVTLNGLPMAACRRTWQHQLGVVPQSVVIVNGSLVDNIAIGVPPAEVDLVALAEAVEEAQLGDVVKALPDGLHTEVGERGVRLSGGQRQRVAIARALYRRPSTLIFDEGTAALDSATEAALIDAIQRLQASFTLIMVAHRLATVRSCDRILLVEHGRITGEGAFAELAASHEGFRRLLGDGNT